MAPSSRGLWMVAKGPSSGHCCTWMRGLVQVERASGFMPTAVQIRVRHCSATSGEKPPRKTATPVSMNSSICAGVRTLGIIDDNISYIIDVNTGVAIANRSRTQGTEIPDVGEGRWRSRHAGRQGCNGTNHGSEIMWRSMNHSVHDSGPDVDTTIAAPECRAMSNRNTKGLYRSSLESSPLSRSRSYSKL